MNLSDCGVLPTIPKSSRQDIETAFAELCSSGRVPSKVHSRKSPKPFNNMNNDNA
jgi:hypothetical protein